MPRTIKEWGVLLLCIALCQGAGVLGTFFTVDAIPGWYMTLNKPAFSPPNWVFAPVWATLYTLMGIALFLVWRAKAHIKVCTCAYWAFGIQLALNATWSIAFFGLKSPELALANIGALLIAIVFTIKYFYIASKTAAWLLVPYLLWVAFATILNASIVFLN